MLILDIRRLFHFQIVEKCVYWKNVPPALKESRRQVMDQMLRSRATSTTKRYLVEIKKFFKWSRANGIEIDLPYESSIAAIYIGDVAKRVKCSHSVVLAFSALKWLHSFIPVANPLDIDLCRNIVEAAKRDKGKPITKKTPVTNVMIKEIIDKYGKPGCSLKDIRIATMCTLAFAGFLRYDEFSNVLVKHLVFHDRHMTIFIPKSKTDIYREGNIVYIGRSHTEYCPVELTLRYMLEGNIQQGSDLPLFRSLNYHRKSKNYSLRKSGLSYTRCLELFKDCLRGLGYNPKDFGLHSLRSGGISAAVRNSNNTISERLLKLHGRWKCDIAKDMYVHEDIKRRLQVTCSLGL